MKFRTTMKEIKNSFLDRNVISIPYCDLCELLCWEDPAAYTCGVYGWNADVYFIGGYALVTGYRPFGKSVSNDIIKEYNKRAYKILHDRRGLRSITIKNKLHNLLIEFCQKAAN